QQAAWDTTNRIVQRNAGRADDDNGADPADHGATQLVRPGAEGDDDDRHFESLQNDPLEGKEPGSPVHTGLPPQLRITVRVAAADPCEPASGDSHDALAKPLQAEDEQQRADHQTKRTDRNNTE